MIKAEANARKQSSNASSPSSSPTIRGKSINDSPSAIYLLRNSLFGANTERRGTQVIKSIAIATLKYVLIVINITIRLIARRMHYLLIVQTYFRWIS